MQISVPSDGNDQSSNIPGLKNLACSLGRKFIVHKKCDSQFLQQIVDMYRKKVCSISEISEEILEERDIVEIEYDVIGTIKRVNDLFEVTFEFFISHEKSIDHLHEYCGKMLHLTIKGECTNHESHLLENGWMSLTDGSCIELKTNVLNGMESPPLSQISSLSETEDIFTKIVNLVSNLIEVFKSSPSSETPVVISKIIMNSVVKVDYILSNKKILQETIFIENTENELPSIPLQEHSLMHLQTDLDPNSLNHEYFFSGDRNPPLLPNLEINTQSISVLNVVSLFSEKVVPLIDDLQLIVNESFVSQKNRKPKKLKRRFQVIPLVRPSMINLQKLEEMLSRQHSYFIPPALPCPEETTPLLVVEDSELDFKEVLKFGRLRGSITSVTTRQLMVSETIESRILTTDVLTLIGNCLMQEILVETSPHKKQNLLNCLSNFQMVSKQWWKACTNLIADYEKMILPKVLVSKKDLFPNDISKMITDCANLRKLSVGTFYLDSKILKQREPEKQAIPAALPTSCGCHVLYDTKKAPIYKLQDVSYFMHPKFSFATTLIDFISWPIIEHFDLLYIEDPLKRPALAMPYAYQMLDSEVKGKGVFVLQRLSIGKSKEWWVFIDKLLNENSHEARIVCFLQDYDKSINKKLMGDATSSAQEETSLIYLEWLDRFLRGETCEDLPSSERGIQEAVDTKRRIFHYHYMKDINK